MFSFFVMLTVHRDWFFWPFCRTRINAEQKRRFFSRCVGTNYDFLNGWAIGPNPGKNRD